MVRNGSATEDGSPTQAARLGPAGMRYSQIGWQWKLMAWAIFLSMMAVVWWFFYNLAYVWLPREIAALLGFLILGLGVGFVIGEKSARRDRDRNF